MFVVVVVELETVVIVAKVSVALFVVVVVEKEMVVIVVG